MPRKKPASSPATTPAQGAPQGDDVAQAAKLAQVAKPARTGSTVTVGLKLPNGLVLQLQEKVKVSYPVLGGGMREVEESRPMPDQQTYTLHGNRAPFGVQPRCLIVAGYAMTPGIPKDFWDMWLSQNSKLDIVKGGFIMAHASQDHVSGYAKEHRGERSGLEPITPGKDPRIPKRPKRGGGMEDAIETGDEQPKEQAA